MELSFCNVQKRRENISEFSAGPFNLCICMCVRVWSAELYKPSFEVKVRMLTNLSFARDFLLRRLLCVEHWLYKNRLTCVLLARCFLALAGWSTVPEKNMKSMQTSLFFSPHSLSFSLPLSHPLSLGLSLSLSVRKPSRSIVAETRTLCVCAYRSFVQFFAIRQDALRFSVSFLPSLFVIIYTISLYIYDST